MSQTGPFSGTNAYSDYSAGSDDWSDYPNVYSSDDGYALAYIYDTSSSTYLAITGFDANGLSVPSGATITGVQVKVERSCGGPFIEDAGVYLIVGGTIHGDDRAHLGAKWLTSDSFGTYGGDGDLWGLSLTDTDIDSDFGVAIQALAAGSDDTAYVDNVEITVFYYLGAAPSSAGPESPTGYSTNAGSGTYDWSDPSEIITSDDTYAVVTDAFPGDITYYLEAYDFGFAVSGTIRGIKVEIEKHSANGYSMDYSVRLINDSSAYAGDDRAKFGELWPAGTDAVSTYGGDSDMWGYAWTPSIVNNSNFGVAIAAIVHPSALDRDTFFVDAITITVYYSDDLYVASGGATLNSSAVIRMPIQNWKGNSGSCLKFDGIDDYVAGPSTSALSPSQMTVSFWTKNDGTPSIWDAHIGKSTSSAWNDGWGFFYQSSTEIRFFINQYNVSYASKTGITHSNWNHVVGTWDGTTIKLYVNNSIGTNGTYSGAQTGTGLQLTVGRVGSSIYSIQGRMEDVRIYSRVLTATEITQLYNGQGQGVSTTGLLLCWKFNEGNPNTTVLDHSGNGRTGTLTNGPFYEFYA